ncbi:hypothetical protein GCM10009841_08360 [Microlunatus panaciterrae]
MAWRLFTESAQRGHPTGYLDIDQLGMRLPTPADDPGNTLIKAANLAVVLANYRAAGAQQVLVSGVALPDEVPAFEAAGADITWVRLEADRAQLHTRFLGRDGQSELLPDLDQHAATLAQSDFAEVTIDTTGLTVAAVVKRVQDSLAHWSQVADRDRPKIIGKPPAVSRLSGAANAQPRVLLLCGPRAVGTSTVGWETFQHLWGLRTSAFVDLAQVGFVGEASVAPLGRHRLRAHNLAAMARNFHQGGATVVIAVGSILHSADLRAYSEALAPGTLTVGRLRATSDHLRQRVAARTAVRGGPHLAGDCLRGRAVAELGPVIDQALAESTLLDRSGIGDVVIDTSGRAPTDCADELLDAVGLTSR